jgi:hypothetical protein
MLAACISASSALRRRTGPPVVAAGHLGCGGLNHGPFGENFMVADLADTDTVLDT